MGEGGMKERMERWKGKEVGEEGRRKEKGK